MDPHSGLGELAGDTGGLLIRNTNDLSAGFRRVDEDMRNYYVLTYVPSNDVFDGKFRTIKVNVKRGGIDVAVAQGLLRRARSRRVAREDVRGARAGDARRHAGAQRVSRTGRRREVPRARSAWGWSRSWWRCRRPTSRSCRPKTSRRSTPTSRSLSVSGTRPTRSCAS